MPIDEGLKKILKIIAKKSNFKTENSVSDNAIVEESGFVSLRKLIRNMRFNNIIVDQAGINKIEYKWLTSFCNAMNAYTVLV